jgi:hypothetical protein
MEKRKTPPLARNKPARMATQRRFSELRRGHPSSMLDVARIMVVTASSASLTSISKGTSGCNFVLRKVCVILTNYFGSIVRAGLAT